MRKVLRIITISAGIVSVVSAIILGCIYLEDASRHIKKLKIRLLNRINTKNIGREDECE